LDSLCAEVSHSASSLLGREKKKAKVSSFVGTRRRKSPFLPRERKKKESLHPIEREKRKGDSQPDYPPTKGDAKRRLLVKHIL